MSWQTLLADQKIKTHSTSKRELDDLREIVERDLRDAAIPGLSTDRRFATAYNAALQTSTTAVACSGYRVSGVGHHIATFEAAELALGPASAQSMAYFDACRRKRNSVDYDRAHVASETEATEIVSKRETSDLFTENWIAQHYPQFKNT